MTVINKYTNSPKQKNEIDAMVYELFGLTDEEI